MALIYAAYAGNTLSSQDGTKKSPLSSTGKPYPTKKPAEFSLNVGTIFAATNPEALEAAPACADDASDYSQPQQAVNSASSCALVIAARNEHQTFGGDAPRV